MTLHKVRHKFKVNLLSFFTYKLPIAGIDYTSIAQPLTFTPGSGSQQRCADITILDDSVVESTEMFLVSLSNSANDADHVDFNSFGTAVVSITNDDGKLQHACMHLCCFVVPF